MHLTRNDVCQTQAKRLLKFEWNRRRVYFTSVEHLGCNVQISSSVISLSSHISGEFAVAIINSSYSTEYCSIKDEPRPVTITAHVLFGWEYTPNANMADRSVVAWDELHEREANEA